jgi:hypothetical protein
MGPDEYETLLETLLTALALQAGGEITLPVPEVINCGNKYLLSIETDWGARTVTLAVQEIYLKLFPPENGRAGTRPRRPRKRDRHRPETAPPA